MKRVRVSARRWNELVRGYFRNRLRSVVPARVEPWRHPWFTRLGWDAERGRWAAQVKPGFCQSAGGVGVETPAGEFLSDDPPPVIAIENSRWRSIGTDGFAGGAEVVPAFFANLGVLPLRSVDRELTPFGVVETIEGSLAQREDARLLRAVELVLYADRLQTAVTVAVGDSAGLEGSFAEVSLTLTSRPDGRARPYLAIERSFEEPAAVDFETQLGGGPIDEGRDARQIATLYLLSRPGETPGADPDETWQPFVRHHTFWNLRYTQRVPEIPQVPNRLQVAVASLGTGLVGQLGNPILSVINDANAAATVATFLASEVSGGRFYGV